MNGEIQGVLVAVSGVVAVRLVLTGAYLSYLKESMRLPLLVTGVVLIALGVATLVKALRRNGDSHGDDHVHAHDGTDAGGLEAAHAGLIGDHDDPDHDGHGHAPGHGPRIAWLLLLPVAVLLLVAPAPLGAYAASRDDTTPPVEAPIGVSFPALPAGDPVPLTLTDYVQRALYDSDESLDGRTVQLSGFVVNDVERTGEGAVLLTRFVLSCCAADGFPVQIVASGLGGPPPPDDTWLELEGTWVDVPSDGGPRDAVLQVSAQREIPVPQNPYE